jgi:hypothetical protein
VHLAMTSVASKCDPSTHEMKGGQLADMPLN